MQPIAESLCKLGIAAKHAAFMIVIVKHAETAGTERSPQFRLLFQI
jgi:hypothetical protein